MDTWDYFMAWGLYLLAALVLSVLCWRFMARYLWRELALVLQALLVAFLFTPWYVSADQDYLGPAFMIFAMDSITIGSTEGVRSLIPLVMATSAALLVALVLIIIRRFSHRR